MKCPGPDTAFAEISAGAQRAADHGATNEEVLESLLIHAAAQAVLADCDEANFLAGARVAYRRVLQTHVQQEARAAGALVVTSCVS